jgi:uncharacterized membrane protein
MADLIAIGYAMSKYGGTVLKTSSLSKQGEQELQEALRGRAA